MHEVGPFLKSGYIHMYVHVMYIYTWSLWPAAPLLKFSTYVHVIQYCTVYVNILFPFLTSLLSLFLSLSLSLSLSPVCRYSEALWRWVSVGSSSQWCWTSRSYRVHKMERNGENNLNFVELLNHTHTHTHTYVHINCIILRTCIIMYCNWGTVHEMHCWVHPN